MQIKNLIKEVPFNYKYYLKKEILHHNNRTVDMEIFEKIIIHLKEIPEKQRLILLHSMLLGLRISEVCCLKGNAYYWQGRDAWIQVYQIKMETYKRIPIPEVLYKIMKIYVEKYGIGSEDYVFQNKNGGAYHCGSFRFQMKKIFNENSNILPKYDFKSHDFRHTIATMLYDDGVPLQSIRDYLGHDYEEMTQQYVDYMPKRISKANQELFKRKKIALLAVFIKPGEVFDLEMLAMELITIFVFQAIAGIVIAIRLRFAGEKGRFVLPIAVLIVFASCYIIRFFVRANSGLKESISYMIGETGDFGIAIALIVLSLIVWFASYKYSMRVMKKKEF